MNPDPIIHIENLKVCYGSFVAVDGLNLELFAGLYRVPLERINECLRLVELTDAADVKVKGYSLGMRRKLLMSRALLHQPPVLYLDEPTANLDVHSAEVMHRILRQLVGQGRTRSEEHT